MSDETLLKISEAAEYAGMHPNSIRRWISNGVLPYYQTVKHAPCKVRKSELDKMLSERRKETTAETTSSG